MRERAVAAMLVLAIAVGMSIDCRRRSTASSLAGVVLNDGVLRAVVLGDSVARGAGDERALGIAGALDDEFRARRWRASAVLNLGINGARTRNVRNLLGREVVRSSLRTADVVVLSIGGNDLYGDPAARLLSRVAPSLQQYATLARVERVLAAIRELNPAARVYVLGLYNPYRNSTLAVWLDRQVNLWDARLIMRFASMRTVHVIRICDLLQREDRISSRDRFHPGSLGYRMIAERIASSL